MTLTTIIILIILGVVLLLLEFLVIPGTTIAGIGGILLIAIAVYYGYEVYGTKTGHIAFLFCLLNLTPLPTLGAFRYSAKVVIP